MQIVSTFTTTLFLSVTIALPTAFGLNGEGTNESSELKCGVATNGVRGEVEVVVRQGRAAEIVVWVNHIADTNPVSSDDVFSKMLRKDWDYYMATNSFCGPIELRDSENRVLPAVKLRIDPQFSGSEFPLYPDVSSLEAYPASYSLSTEYGRYLARFRHGYSGPGVFPLPLFFAATRSEMVRLQLGDSVETKEPHRAATLYQRLFRLRDCFTIMEPGQYTLTVWPKIYRRSTANPDICHRFDVPPVSAMFTLDAKSAQ